jgi:nitrate/TMAO reductase-like tetraheme cytochrome c subunit
VTRNDATPTAATTGPAPAAAAPWWWRVLGIRRRVGARRVKWLKVAPSRWGWVLLIGVLGLAGSGAFAEYSMQPDFCRSCHLMEPYYKAWHTSTHNKVPCTDCHFEPGLENTLKGKWEASSQAAKYITGTYGSKPHAQIHDSSCMRSGCHEKRLLEGKVNWTVKGVSGGDVTIRFDHAPHLGQLRLGKQLRCVSCHSQIVQGEHLVVTLDTCFLCHMKNREHGRKEETLGGCRACHDAPKEKIRLATGMFNHGDYLDRGVTCDNCHSDVIRGNGTVPRQMCWNCHNQPAQVAKYNEPGLLHEEHVNKHKVECSACHTQIEHFLNAGAKLTDVKAGAAAAAAHGSTDTNTCAQCHEQTHLGPADLYRGTGGRGVPDMPSPMFRAQVDCIACHKAQKRDANDAGVVGQTFVAVQDSCNYCHATKYDGVLDAWHRLIDGSLAKTEADVASATAEARAAQMSPEQRKQADQLLADAAHNVRLVKLGHGVHNVNYATAVLSVARENCNKVRRLAGGAGSSAAAAGAGP